MKKKYINYSILILVIIFMVFLTMKFSNLFGSNTDWINQHTIFPEYFRDYFYTTGQLIPEFSFNFGAGQNMFNLSYYGFLSPLILPSYLLPFIPMTTYITIINIIVLIASAILFYNWLKNHEFSDFVCLITSLIFILSAPLIFHMHRHIMFVNYMPFLIMSLMGVDKFIKNNQKVLLIISIFLMIMTSYYYSVCGLLVIGIYYLYQYFYQNKKINLSSFIKNLFLFIGLCAISILMAGVLLLPTLNTLIIGRGESETSINLISLFTPYLKFHKLFCGTYGIGLSTLGFMALLYLFYTKKRHNVLVATLISIVLFTPIFRYLLNGGLYLREKCFIPFLPLLSLFVGYFLKDLFEKKISIKKFIIFLLVIFIPLYFFNSELHCYIQLVIFLISFLLYNKYSKKIIIAFPLVMTIFAIACYEASIEDVVSYDEYNELFNKKVEESINKINQYDKSYYRTNNLLHPTTTVNKIYNMDYFTTNIYSSTYNNNYLNFVRNIFKTSMLDYNYFMISSISNNLFNTFMGVKYVYSDYNLGLGYEKISDNLYVNTNSYPLIYATNNVIDESYFDTYDYPYQIELLLKNGVVSSSKLTKQAEIETKEIDLKFNLIKNDGVIVSKTKDGYVLEVKDKGYLTLMLDNELKNKILFLNILGLKENSCNIDNISMKINNVENILTCKSWIYGNKNNTFHYVFAEDNLRQFNVELNKGVYNITDIETYILDYDEIKNIKNSFIEFKIHELSNNKIKGYIDLSEDSYLITSIPYDNGFTVKVNNQTRDIEMVNKGFVGLYLEKGNYEIEFIYNSPWLKEGKFVSAIGLGLLIIVLFVDYKKRKNS